ncbi:MAG: hypothetical protein ACRC1P_01235 [Cellulosilyticaceae bacterium]
MIKSKLGRLILCGALFITSLPLSTLAVQNMDTSNPVYINYILNQVEDKLEDSFDKQYKVDWDFEISYNNGIITLIIEYDKDDAKIFNKLTKEKIVELISTIAKEVKLALGKDFPIEGLIKEDDTNKVRYTFSYKNGNLDIK